MNYRFPLQKVLDVKVKEKQQAQQELGISLQRQVRVQEELGRLMEKLETARRQLHLEGAGVPAVRLREAQRYIEFLHQQMQRLQGTLRRMEKEVEKRQQVLTEKSKEEKVWQEWKRHLGERHRQEMDRQEQQMLDEMAMIRYFRQQRRP